MNTIDWTKPLELIDGTPVHLKLRDHFKPNPDADGDYYLVRSDDENFADTGSGTLIVGPDGRHWLMAQGQVLVRNQTTTPALDWTKPLETVPDERNPNPIPCSVRHIEDDGSEATVNINGSWYNQNGTNNGDDFWWYNANGEQSDTYIPRIRNVITPTRTYTLNATNYDYQGNPVHILAHPLNPALIIVSSPHNIHLHHAYTTEFTSTYTDPEAEADAQWAALDRDLRSVLSAAGTTKKIAAIKHLRAVTEPRLSLTQAKRLIEKHAA